jgi:hypothetical protein
MYQNLNRWNIIRRLLIVYLSNSVKSQETSNFVLELLGIIHGKFGTPQVDFFPEISSALMEWY